MSRHILTLSSDLIREKAIRWIRGLPPDTRVEFKAPKRTPDQNARMWAMLGDIAKQKRHHGIEYSPADWKVIFLHALGRETRFVPALHGTGFLPIGQSSSDLSKAEFSDLIELLSSWGAENRVVWSDPALAGADPREAQRAA